MDIPWTSTSTTATSAPGAMSTLTRACVASYATALTPHLHHHTPCPSRVPLPAMTRYGLVRCLRPVDRQMHLDMNMAHDMRTPTLTRIHTRISRDVSRHSRFHTDTHHMGMVKHMATVKRRNASTEPRSRCMRFRARIRGSRRRYVPRLRRIRVAPRVTAIGIDITAPWVEADARGRGRGKNATDRGIRQEGSRLTFPSQLLSVLCF